MKMSTAFVTFVFLIVPSQGAWLPELKSSGFTGYLYSPDVLWRFLDFLIPNSQIEENVFFYLYTRANYEVPEQLWVNNKVVLANSHFDVTKKTLIILHGFNTDYTAHSAQGPKTEYLTYDNVNVILPDYGNINYDPTYLFFFTVAKSFKIARFLGQFVVFLIDQGVDPDNIHIIGHSLGAHIAGSAGKYVKNHGKRIGRVTGLDPCYPVYEYNSANYRLAPDDAKFTDCIFTSYGSLGMGIPVCQANFFPNGAGMTQPACAIESPFFVEGCGHSIAPDYFIDSIRPHSGFHVQKCDGVPEAQDPPHCRPTAKTVMGEHANPQVSGLFYLKTKAQPPYSEAD